MRGMNCIVHCLKSFAAGAMQHQYKRSGRVWQDEYLDRIVCDDKESCRSLSVTVANLW
jgi:hypothetical protein